MILLAVTDCMYETSKKTGVKRRLRVDYPEIAQAALGKKGHFTFYIYNSILIFKQLHFKQLLLLLATAT